MYIRTPLGSTITSTHLLIGFGDGALIGLILGICLCFSAFRRRPLSQKICYCLLYTYLGILVSLTVPIILPAGFHLSASSVNYALSSMIITPFESSWQIFKNCVLIDEYSAFIRLIGGNLALLMPLGILVPILQKRFRFPQMLLLAFLTSLGIEFIQLMMNMLYGSLIRVVEIDDIIFNVLGCILAYGAFTLVRRVFSFKR